MASEAAPLVTFRKDAPIVTGIAAPESMQDLASMKRFDDQVMEIAKKCRSRPRMSQRRTLN